MLLVEAPREAAVPPCAAPLDLPMSTLTKLSFTDYSAKVNKPYPESQQEQSANARLSYDQALASVTRLNFEQSVANSGKLQYAEQRLPFDPSVDAMCSSDQAYLLSTG